MEHFDVSIKEYAWNDYEEILNFVKGNPKTALVFHETIFEMMKNLSAFPKLGRLVPDEELAESGFRILSAGKYNIFYKIYGESIRILRILHVSRDYITVLKKIDKEAEKID